VLHRDVKPSNVLITPDGRVLLTDFGLAKVAGIADLTRSTAQLGSLPYLPPECLGGQRPIAQPTLDVYQLGVVLYEMLALEHPYRGEHQEATRRNILEGRPAPLRGHNRSVERDLETVCLVAMDPAPGQRYASMAALLHDIDNLAERRAIAARRPGIAYRSWRWLQRNPALAFAAVITLLVATTAALVVAGIERRARVVSDDLTERARYDLYRANLTAATAMLDGAANPARAQELLRGCPA
jgi:serine/threonine protein kinase